MLSTLCRIWYFPAFQYHYCHTSALLNQQLVKCWCCYDQSGLSESVSSPAFTKRGETNAHCFCFRNRYTIIKWFLMPLGDKCGEAPMHTEVTEKQMPWSLHWDRKTLQKMMLSTSSSCAPNYSISFSRGTVPLNPTLKPS